MPVKRDLRMQTPDLFRIFVAQTTKLQVDQIEQIIDVLGTYGCVLLDCGMASDPRQDLLSLKHVFGNTLGHSLAQEGIVTITPVEGAIYDGLTNQAQSLHTDGSFNPIPPPVVALQCEVSAHHGGLSQVVQAEQVYRYLAQHQIPGWMSLFDADAIEISTVGDNKRATHSVFRWHHQRLHMIFKSSAMRVKVEPKPEAELAYRAIQTYISNPDNQLQFHMKEGQILLMDNGRILHARTAFSTEQRVRRMNRLWFDGLSPYSERLDLGFLPSVQANAEQETSPTLAQFL